MKKIISFLLVTMLMLTCVVSVSAADVTKGINVNFVEDKDGLVTATVSAVGIPNLSNVILGVTYDSAVATLLNNDKATVASTINWDNVVEKINVGTLGKLDLSLTNSNKTLKFTTGASDVGQKLDATSSVDMYKFYFKKVDGKTISDSTFTIYYKKLGGQMYYQVEGSTNKYTFDNVENISFTITPYTAPAGETWQETVTDTTTGDIKFPETSDKIGTDNDADLKTDADVKKVVIFAKAVDALTGTKDGSANYGITIGGMYYPGYLSVPKGSNWSIILVDPANTLTDNYTASVTVNGETKTLENVSFK